MTRKLTPPDQIKGFPTWIGISECDQRVRRPDEPPPRNKWVGFCDWLLGDRALHISERIDRWFPPRV
jgi:hypothetical protein